ncbi:MAG: hypothetical protein OXU45_09910 [Candidatus Melainabacteria bacterium]|nr:hypothetical protein [Candidatus Melainabacteria bacterium]
MNLKRIVIGSLIGVLSFALISWTSPASWRNIESPLLSAQSILRILSPFPKTKFQVFEFNEDEKFNLPEMLVSEQKDLVLSLVTELASHGARDIKLLINEENIYRISEAELKTAVADYNTEVERTSRKNLNRAIETRTEAGLMLDQKSYGNKRHAISNILAGKLNEKKTQTRTNILISPKLDLKKSELSDFKNYFSDRWVNYVQFHPLLSFILLVTAGVFLTAMIYWARIVSFFALNLSLLVLGQIGVSFFNTHLEIMPLILGLTAVLLISSVFDLNFFNFKLSSIYQAKPKQAKPSPVSEDPRMVLTTPFVQAGEQVQHNQVEAMQSKFFRQQEEELEAIALKFQERTIGPIISMQEQMKELLEASPSNQLETTCRYFNDLIEEIDGILFSLAPFKFEDGRGLLSLLELFAAKIQIASHGLIQLQLGSEFSKLKLSADEKIHSYRIIQKMLELIITNNQNTQGRQMPIFLKLEMHGPRLHCTISYEGKPAKADSNKMMELEKRLEILKAGKINYGITELAEVAENIINTMEFSFEASSLEAAKHSSQVA